MPTTSRITSRPASTSEAMVCAEMKAMPSPAITACLIVSLRTHLDAEVVEAARQFAEENLQRDARAGARFADEEVLLGDALLGNVARPGERMVGRRDDHQRVVAEGGGAHRHVLGRPSHQRDVDIVVLQAGDGLGAVADDEPHLDVGILLHEGRHQPRREIFGGRDDAEPEAAGAHALDRVDLVLQQAQPLLDRLRGVDERRPAAVGRMPSLVRSNSASPTSSSSCRSWIVTAGGVRPNTLAALTILPWSAIAWTALSCLSVRLRMQSE